ncbi:MAG TPA: inositol monophosphatase family protein [Thermohalobaculum sp.]|nr:inositol monophosphatase family protein [Thermohalobaculum sp.]
MPPAISTDLTDQLTRFAETLADESRAILNDAAGRLPEVDIKSDLSYVTDTDRAVEQRLREMIDREFPDHGVMGEEFGSRDLDAEYVWVLDPIDGTAAFVAGIPVFGTLIGVARQGRPWIGVIDHPATAERWVGVSGERATLNGKAIKTRPCGDLASALMTNSNPDFFQPAERTVFETLRSQVRYTQYGGSCYAYGVLASGRTDLAIDGGLEPFDIFAPAAVIEGAGGVVTDWSGAGITLGWNDLVLAAGDCNLHAKVLSELSSGR